MADRGLCAVCGGDYAIAKDGTPYKHSTEGEDICPGSDLQILMNVEDAVWLVYASEGRFVVFGPVEKGADHPATHASLPFLAEVASASPEDVNPVLPEGLSIPTGEPTPDEEPEIPEPAEDTVEPTEDQTPPAEEDVQPAPTPDPTATPKKRTSRKKAD